jgi:hypothetical protein
MIRMFSAYAVLGPLLLIPASYWLWLGRYDGDHRLTLLTLATPIVYAYVIPGVGANVLKLWRIDTPVRWGRIRLHHGFVFGSAAAFLAFLATTETTAPPTLPGAARSAFVVGSTFAFWNWLYDAHAIRAGKIRIHVQPHIPEKSPSGIAMEHALTMFGGFGAAYAVWLAMLPWAMAGAGSGRAALVLAAGVALVIATPVGGFVLGSYLKYGVSGLRPLGALGFYEPETGHGRGEARREPPREAS